MIKNVEKFFLTESITGVKTLKKLRLSFSKTHLAAAILLFSIEFCIARFVHDAIIRPYAGDLLVVILIYCTIKTFVDAPVSTTVFGALLFAYAVEISQYFHLVKHLGWQGSALAHIVLGSSFSLIDMLLYTIGAAIIIITENMTAWVRAFKYKI